MRSIGEIAGKLIADMRNEFEAGSSAEEVKRAHPLTHRRQGGRGDGFEPGKDAGTTKAPASFRGGKKSGRDDNAAETPLPSPGASKPMQHTGDNVIEFRAAPSAYRPGRIQSRPNGRSGRLIYMGGGH